MLLAKNRILSFTLMCLLAAVAAPHAIADDGDFEKGILAYVSGDLDGARQAWLPLAEAGDARAMFHLGELTMSRPDAAGESKDDAAAREAVAWFERAAEMNYTPAQTALGIAYESGHGADVNYEAAAKWWQLAADHGDSRAQFFLGRLYEAGRGVNKSLPTARYFYESAASKGDLRAQAAVDALDGNPQESVAALTPKELPAINIANPASRRTDSTTPPVPQTTAGSEPKKTEAVAKATDSIKASVATAAEQSKPKPEPRKAVTGSRSGDDELGDDERVVPSSIIISESQDAAEEDASATSEAETATRAPAASAADEAKADVTLAAVSETAANETAVKSKQDIGSAADEQAQSVDTGTAESATPPSPASDEPAADAATGEADENDTQPVETAKADSRGASDTTAHSEVVDWIAKTPEGHYTIQLFVTGEESAAKEFIDTYQLTDAKYYYHKSAASGWYKIIFGRYASAEQAREERSKFPAAVQRYSPWIRSFDSIRKELGVKQSSVELPTAPAGPATVSESASAELASAQDVPETPAVSTTRTVEAIPTSTQTPPTTTSNESTDISDEPRASAASERGAADGNTVAESAVDDATVGAEADDTVDINAEVASIQAASVIQPITDGAPENSQKTTDDGSQNIHLASRNGVAKIAYRNGQRAFNRHDYANAFEFWQPLADSGYADAQYGVGFMYEAGWGVDIDLEKAHYWYTEAAQQGYAKAQYQLGMLYLNGSGVPMDDTIAMYWIQSAADRYDARASAQLAKLRARTAQR